MCFLYGVVYSNENLHRRTASDVGLGELSVHFYGLSFLSNRYLTPFFSTLLLVQPCIHQLLRPSYDLRRYLLAPPYLKYILFRLLPTRDKNDPSHQVTKSFGPLFKFHSGNDCLIDFHYYLSRAT